MKKRGTTREGGGGMVNLNKLDFRGSIILPHHMYDDKEKEKTEEGKVTN